VVAIVLPLVAPEVWVGFRLGLADPVLSAINPSEQPLSVRTPGGQWAVGLALVWFSLAYWHGCVQPWEVALVLGGGTAALLRNGNLWLDALALSLPLARQLQHTPLPRPGLLCGLAISGSLAVATATVVTTRPPALPAEAIQAVQAAPAEGSVFADWRWAPELQRDLGSARHVLAAGGLASESPDFWLDYVRVAQDHEQWQTALDRRDVGLLVVDADLTGLVDQVRASGQWRVVYDAGRVLVAQRARA
jgi:hypothetical protein